ALLSQEFLIGVTKFFRDQEAFELLEKETIPEILQTIPEEETIKVWATACSTGEEVYSLAMLFMEAFEKLNREPQIKLFATDIDQRALGVASKGVYPSTIAKDVSEERLQRFFTLKANKYTIKDEVRRLVV